MKIYLPGHTEPTSVTFEVRRGIAFMEGDIELGPIKELEKRKHSPALPDSVFKTWKKSRTHNARMAVRNMSRYLWPSRTIPYVIDSAFNQKNKTGNTDMRALIRDAIDILNRDTVLTLRPKRSGDCNSVRIVYDGTLGGAGSSSVGMQGGEQKLRLKHSAKKGTVIHEFLHAAGFWHTHSRPDRDAYVEVIWDNIQADHQHNFNKRTHTSIAVGPYSVESIMHYSSFGFAEDPSLPTLVLNDGPKRWFGRAPFCWASSRTCRRKNMRFVKSSKTGGGMRCWFGQKVQCQQYIFKQNRDYIPASDQEAIREAYLNVSSNSGCS